MSGPDERPLQLKLLRNFFDFRRWSNSDDGFGYRANKYSSRETRRQRDLELTRMQPVRYPCYVSTVCVSFGMEETEPRFLYVDQLPAMIAKAAGGR